MAYTLSDLAPNAGMTVGRFGILEVEGLMVTPQTSPAQAGA